jgi:hypothetical protein
MQSTWRYLCAYRSGRLSSGCHERAKLDENHPPTCKMMSSRGASQTVLPSADTAAMLL